MGKQQRRRELWSAAAVNVAVTSAARSICPACSVANPPQNPWARSVADLVDVDRNPDNPNFDCPKPSSKVVHRWISSSRGKNFQASAIILDATELEGGGELP